MQKAFRCLTGKQPTAHQSEVLESLLRDERKQFAGSPEDAERVRTKNGDTKPDASLSCVEVAATTMLTRALFGYEECVMKP